MQDDIRVRKNLTISPGIRYEAQTHLSDYNNFGPRFGVTWSPGKSGKWTLRGSAGIFYDWLSTSIYEQTLRIDGVRQQEINIVDPPYPDPGGRHRHGHRDQPLFPRRRPARAAQHARQRRLRPGPDQDDPRQRHLRVRPGRESDARPQPQFADRRRPPQPELRQRRRSGRRRGVAGAHAEHRHRHQLQRRLEPERAGHDQRRQHDHGDGQRPRRAGARRREEPGERALELAPHADVRQPRVRTQSQRHRRRVRDADHGPAARRLGSVRRSTYIAASTSTGAARSCATSPPTSASTRPARRRTRFTAASTPTAIWSSTIGPPASAATARAAARSGR